MPIKQEYDEVIFLNRTSFSVLPVQNIATSMSAAIPDVSNLHLLVFTNTVPTNVTNFTGGSDGQRLKIIGDGQTTLVNNSTIKTNIFVDKLLQALTYEFVYYSGVWYEQD